MSCQQSTHHYYAVDSPRFFFSVHDLDGEASMSGVHHVVTSHWDILTPSVRKKAIPPPHLAQLHV